MEDLSKNQIILLSVLISFVTSLATGIMTVSLLQEAPIEVTRNINRIVEKTIETVTPAAVITATTPQKEVTTVIVKEEDQIIDSINKNIHSIVRIEEKDGIESKTTFYGMGLVVTREGFVVADRKTINSTSAYTIVTSDGTKLPAKPLGVDKQTNFIIFDAEDRPTLKVGEKPESVPAYVFIPAKFIDSDVKLGQSLISVGGDSENAVAIGRVISVVTKDNTVGSTTTKTITNIETDLSTKDLLSGSPLLNLSGDVIGMKISNESSKSFIPVSLIKKDIVILSEPQKTQ